MRAETYMQNVEPERQVRFHGRTRYLARRDILRATVHRVEQFGRSLLTKHRDEGIYPLPRVEGADRPSSPDLRVCRAALGSWITDWGNHSSSKLPWAPCIQSVKNFTLLIDGIPNLEKHHSTTPSPADSLTRTTREDVSPIAPWSYPSSQPEGLIHAYQPGVPHTFPQTWTTEYNPTGQPSPFTFHLTDLAESTKA